MITCYYHDSCVDGLMAAYVVNKYCHAVLGTASNLVPVQYGGELPPVWENETVFIVDFTFTEEQMFEIIKLSKAVYHFDHHAGVEELINKLNEHYKGTNRYISVYDEDRSGAGITWDYLFGSDTRNGLVNLVEDRDLYRFNYGGSRSLYEYLAKKIWLEPDQNEHFTSAMAFSIFDKLNDPGEFLIAVEIGKDLIERRDIRCRGQIDKGFKVVQLESIDGKMVDFTFTELADVNDRSEQIKMMVNQKLNDSEYFGVYYHNKEKSTIKVRLSTSIPGGSVINFAKTYGGGGHHKASSFVLDAGVQHPVAYELIYGVTLPIKK